MGYRLPALLLLVPGLVLGGCASRANRVAGDPLEPMNRALFDFNTAMDKTILIPVSKTYQTVTPKPARNGIRNFLNNLGSPVILVNDVLQGEWKRAGITISRFAINTTAGVGGLFDVAKRNGLERHNEDFGQTMAIAGIGAGPYLVLPLLGPSSLRDAFGRLPDHYFAPLTYTQFDGKSTYLTTSRAVDIVDKRARALKLVKKLRQTAFDEYNSVRDLYWQTRKDEIANGHTQIETLPEFDISSTE
ncbi:MAG: VacJ family lipoprotein [Robiginitomaculum sp.]|nr:VacJ family lipoprotein [Robiginitomaculum sp.]MDQ7078352.1 VacJ family lipoprotein [Robiginitomaculum sp.]